MADPMPSARHRLRPRARGLRRAAPVLVLTVLLGGCGFALATDPTPPTDPPTTTVPITIPEGGLVNDGFGEVVDENGDPLTQPTLPPAPEAPMVTTTVPPLSEYEQLMGRDDREICDFSDEVAFRGATIGTLATTLEERSPTLTPAQQQDGIRDMGILYDGLARLVTVLPENDIQVDQAAIDGALADLRERINQEPADGDVRTTLQNWVGDHSDILFEVIDAVGEQCPNGVLMSLLLAGSR